MQRRHFLLSGALASRAAWSQSTEQPIGLAYIGVGNRGSYLLTGGMDQANIRVAALCDNKGDRLDKAATAAAKSQPFTTADWRRVLERKDVDAVFIATPPHLHVEMALAALAAGKHVYCEKPIGLTPASIRQLVQAAKASKQVFQAGQQLRSMKQLSAAVQKIRDGAIGDILFVKAQRHASADLDHNGPSGDWYFNFAKSGGYLVEQSVHNLDLCNWAIGAHPLRASGFGGVGAHKNDPPGRDIMDHSSLSYEYPNGVTMSFTQLVFHPKTLPAANQIVHVFGTKGAVELLGNNSALMHPREGGEPVLLAPKVEEYPHAHITAFLDCIRKGAPSPSGVEVGAAAALTAILGSEAARTGKVISWSEFGAGV